MTVTRRAALLAGLGVSGLLAGCGSSGPRAGTATSGTFYSRYRHAETGWTVLRPPGHHRAALPVLVALHGRGGDHTSTYRELDLDVVLARLIAGGAPPFAIASADGGDHDYWHPRTTTDPAGMIVHEFLPLLAGRGLDVRRIGLFGWSMGGYGALFLSTVLRAPRVSVAVAESPAIWRHSYQVVEGSFDSPQDFDRHALWGRERLLRGIDLRIDCGAQDGFAPITRRLRSSLHPRPAGGIEAGSHDDDYWRSQAPAQLAFVARHLS